MAIFLFFGVLFILILIHEWGHFIVAKKTGMRVDEFGIGFPPKLFGKKWHGTEYTFNLLPIGGFVKIAGENAEDSKEDGTVPEDSFAAKSKWAQAAVLVAGVSMNILFAWVLFVVVFLAGLPSAIDESSVSDSSELVIAQVLEGTPAAKAGIPLGAHVTEVSAEGDFLEVLTPSGFQSFTQSHQQSNITIVYTHKKTQKEITLSPETGFVIDEPQKAVVGVALTLVETVKLSPLDAVIEASKATISSLGAIIFGITSLAVESMQGTADFSTVAGPIGIVGLVGDAAEFGFVSLLMFTAMISLNLAVINLLPFPALDGGRLLMVGIEALLRRPISPVWVGRVNLIGFVLLLILMVAVTYNDLIKIF